MRTPVSKTFRTAILTVLGGILVGLPPMPGRAENSSVAPTSKNRAASLEEPRAVVSEIGRNMVKIQSGKFEMGDLIGTSESLSKPVRTVSVNDFWISRCEVTFDQYDAYARAVGIHLPPDGR